MACRQINDRYAAEGYIIKEVPWNSALGLRVIDYGLSEE